MNNDVGFHPCSSLPTDFQPLSLLNRDADYLERFRNMFVERRDVAQGGQGYRGFIMIYQRRLSPDSLVAVKYMPYHLDEELTTKTEAVQQQMACNRELAVGCSLNALRKLSSCFLNTYGWLICARVPFTTKWMGDYGTPHISAAKSYLAIFMEYHFITLDNAGKDITRDGAWEAVLFIIFHALYIGRREIGFAHRDLNKHNVMFSEASDMPILLGFSSGQVEITVPGGWRPVLIDYACSISDEFPEPSAGVCSAGTSKRDAANLFEAAGSFDDRIQQLLDDDADVKSFVGNIDRHDYKVIEDFLMTHSMFDKVTFVNSKFTLSNFVVGPLKRRKEASR